jgi:hypothetical protein
MYTSAECIFIPLILSLIYMKCCVHREILCGAFYDGDYSDYGLLNFFLFLYGTGVELSPLLLQPFIGPLYQPWMLDGDDCGTISGMNDCAGETEVPGGNLPQCRSVHHRSHLT